MVTVTKHPLVGWVPADVVVDEGVLLGLRLVPHYRDDEVSTNRNGATAVLDYWDRVGVLGTRADWA